MQLSAAEVDAVREYSGPAYRRINAYLRGEIVGDARLIAIVKLLDDATARESIVADIILYRGIGEPAAERWRRRGLRVGQKITDPGFMSTTADPVVANLFADVPPDGLILKISVPAGSLALNVAPYSLYPGEREYLMPRNTTIRVSGYDAATRTITAEVVKDG